MAYCEEADGLRDLVANAYDASLDNLRILAEANVFSHLSVPGGTEPAGRVTPGPAATPVATPAVRVAASPAAVTPVAEAAPDPVPRPRCHHRSPTPRPSPSAAATEPAETAEPAATGESVQIKDGDRTISVTSPDGEGHVKVSVAGCGREGQDATTSTSTRPAGWRPSRPPDRTADPADPKAAHVPAGTNGQCVIKDGPLTITAERPLFDPGTIKLEVDDGVNEPTTYTLDFDEGAEQGPPGDDQPAGDAPPADAGKAEPPAAAKAEPAADADPGPTDEKSAEKSDEDAPADAADGEKVQVTTPAVADEPSQLVPDQATGEAELATAGGDDPGGAAGGAAGGGGSR